MIVYVLTSDWAIEVFLSAELALIEWTLTLTVWGAQVEIVVGIAAKSIALQN